MSDCMNRRCPNVAEIERLEARCLKLYKANEKLSERIAELEAIVERRNQHCQDCPTFVEQEVIIAKLEAVLKLRGVHGEACTSRDISDRGISFSRHDWTCDCGLRAALQGVTDESD